MLTHWAIFLILTPAMPDFQMALESQLGKYSLLGLYLQKQKKRNKLAIKWITWKKSLKY